MKSFLKTFIASTLGTAFVAVSAGIYINRKNKKIEEKLNEEIAAAAEEAKAPEKAPEQKK